MPLTRLAPLALALAACGTTVKMLPESLDCPVLEARLAAGCAAPAALPDGATFEQVIRACAERTGLPLLKLPEGFSYRTFGWTNEPMADGLTCWIGATSFGTAPVRPFACWAASPT